MFYLERADDKGNWSLMMASPHRISVDDLHGPPEDANHNYLGNSSPGYKSIFAGKRGWQARVRCDDTVVELFKWTRIPLNAMDPDSVTVWGWELVRENRSAIPFEKLWPLSFVG